MKSLPVILALVGVVLIGGGVWWWKMSEADEGVEILSSPGGAAVVGVASESGTWIVDVGGAVVNSGVYRVEVGTRVGEALEAAGGLAGDADLEWVAKYLNKAEKTSDGQKIYIPGKNNQETSSNNQTNSKININVASQGELEGLPGVGPVTAEKIIGGRPYSRVEEVVEKKIVGQKVWEQIKDKISVW